MLVEEIQDSCDKQRAGTAAGREGLATYYRIGRATAVDSYHHKAENENHKGKRHVKAGFMIDLKDSNKRKNSIISHPLWGLLKRSSPLVQKSDGTIPIGAGKGMVEYRAHEVPT